MIVIIDDHRDTGRVMTKLLRQQGFPAHYFESPQAALAVIETLKPSVLILDQMMPGLLGTDVLRAIRNIPALADIPAIFYSACRDGQDEARLLGAKAWLLKGKTSWGELLATILASYRSTHLEQ